MPIAHHPDASTLITCSAGSQPEALCAAVASHISICADCFAEFSRMDSIGRVLFGDLEPQPVTSSATVPSGEGARPADGGARADLAGEMLREPSKSEVPATIAGVVGRDLDALEWTSLGPGIRQHVIRLSPHARGDLRLLRLAPGASLSEHGHGGEEMSLVLRGAYRDGVQTFCVGDFSDLDDDARHQVICTDDDECIILVASETLPEFANAPPP